ncbi:sugar ABC transporter permease [Mergibacter septicus]|uniref:Transport permease protein n=1 Tax=Mergibacter septicus TaxID=221402 RepID=A0A8D4IYG4_9PAST|nr:ABC transporter permease [Mergibacter septicus]AWX15656.1 sugar ABC transporter permease [Mergibacter septicus]QDJ14910.1 sugar ABC transporter permease [Mergibacter septicus]UTU47664.1 ABC transporter permease [Mergibacter septicus]WMR96731.1 ABC transporter permease [Mergibacter septicus]
MQYGNDTTFKQSLVIQGRVIGALIMREIITRYGRNNIGFLWLFVEPLLFTLVIVLMWKFFRANHYSTLNIIAFVITGYPMAMMWRNTSNRVIGAISANISLLYHRNVRVLDTLVSRMLLEIAGATIAQIVIMAVLMLVGWINLPVDVFEMLLAWLLMAFFAIGLGLIISSIVYYFEAFGKIWGTLSFVMLPLSGAFFFVNSFPPKIQQYLLYLPMVNGTEMFRDGYFGHSVTTHFDPMFILKCDLIMLFIGLVLVKRFSKGIEPS